MWSLDWLEPRIAPKLTNVSRPRNAANHVFASRFVITLVKTREQRCRYGRLCVPIDLRSGQARVFRLDDVLTIAFLTKLKGLSAIAVANLRHLSAFRLNDAPGNQPGRYLTDEGVQHRE